MKFSGSQIITILVILVAGIIVSNVYAPGAFSTVVSIASTVVGVLFVNRRDGGDPPTGAGGSPNLKVITGGLSSLVLACASCAAQTETAEKVAKCEGEARAEHYVGQA
jgi:hypothetical protein